MQHGLTMALTNHTMLYLLRNVVSRPRPVFNDSLSIPMLALNELLPRS